MGLKHQFYITKLCIYLFSVPKSYLTDWQKVQLLHYWLLLDVIVFSIEYAKASLCLRLLKYQHAFFYIYTNLLISE